MDTRSGDAGKAHMALQIEFMREYDPDVREHVFAYVTTDGQEKIMVIDAPSEQAARKHLSGFISATRAELDLLENAVYIGSSIHVSK